MKKIVAILTALIILAAALVSCEEAKTEAGEEIDALPDKVVIDVKDFGKISVELYPEIAPITVRNFKKLVNEGYYDGSSFHRVVKGFMIQGGKGRTQAETIKGEFSENNVENDLKHERGVISMARTAYSYDSASSQFFIMHQANDYLDGKYAAFGRVTDGMDVVDAIASVPVNGETPVSTITITSVYFDR